MATSTLVPLSEYLTKSYEPDCEWINGELKERNVGTNSHGTVQTFFIEFFRMHRAEWGIRVVCEVRTRVSADHFRVPDVLVERAETPFEEIVRTPPLLCIEVLSPEDRVSDMQERIDDYITMGVQGIWVVDPRLRRAFVVEDGAWIPVQELSVRGTPIRVTLAEVFAELNALEGKRPVSTQVVQV